MNAKTKQTEARATTTRVKKLSKPVTLYALMDGLRPTSGHNLKAHTAAVFQYFNLMNPARPQVNATALRYAWGERTYSYHSKLDNLETAIVQTNEGPVKMVRLTVKGFNHFGDRKKAGSYDPALADKYAQAMKTGKPTEGTLTAKGSVATPKDYHSQEFAIKATAK